jgi:hypothetical protein
MMIMLDARARDGEEQKENEKDDRERGREREREREKREKRREETGREREKHGEEQIEQIHTYLPSDNLIVAQMRFWWAGQEKCRSQARPMRTLALISTCFTSTCCEGTAVSARDLLLCCSCTFYMYFRPTLVPWY